MKEERLDRVDRAKRAITAHERYIKVATNNVEKGNVLERLRRGYLSYLA